MKLALIILLLAISNLSQGAQQQIPLELASVKLEQPIILGSLHYNGTPLTKENLERETATGGVYAEEAKRMLAAVASDVPNATAGIDIELYRGLVAGITIYVYGSSPRTLEQSLIKRFGDPQRREFSEGGYCPKESLRKWDGEMATLLLVHSKDYPSQFIVLRSNRLYPLYSAALRKKYEIGGFDEKGCSNW